MKRVILTAVLAVAAVSGFAQGTVAFQNGVATRISLVTGTTNSATSAPIGTQTTNFGGIASSGTLNVGLFFGSTAGTATNLAGVVQIGVNAGQINGSTVFAIPGSNPNDVDFFQVFAWDSTYGNTYGSVLQDISAGGWFGSAAAGNANLTYGAMGTPLQFTLGATAGPGAVIFNSISGFFGRTEVLSQVPEPGTLALGGLGAAALLLFRRRKA